MTNEELALRVKQGDRAAAGELWESVKRLLNMLAGRYYYSNRAICEQAGMELDDLKQSCYFAMLKAVNDYSGEYKFTSYLNYHCKNIFNSLCGLRGTKDMLNNCDSLDAPIGEDENICMVDLIPDMEAEDPFNKVLETYEEAAFKQDIHKAVGTLPEKQQCVIRERYFAGKTQSQIAREQNAKHQRISTIEREALRALRTPKKPGYKYLEPHLWRVNVINRYAYSGSLRRWKETGTSSTEYTVFKLDELEKRFD